MYTLSVSFALLDVHMYALCIPEMWFRKLVLTYGAVADCLAAVYLLCAGLLVIAALRISALGHRQRRRLREGACPKCGYSMRGNTSGRCPECGLAFDVRDLPVQKLCSGENRVEDNEEDDKGQPPISGCL